VKPTRRCVLVFAVGVAVALLPAAVSPRLWTLWFAWLGLSLVACCADAVFALPVRRLQLRPRAPDSIAIGDRGILEVEVAHGRGGRLPVLDLLVDLGPHFEPLEPVRLRPDGSSARTELPLVPRRRGTGQVLEVWARWTGPFGLFRRTARGRPGLDVAIVPDVAAVRRTALRFFTSRDFLSGLKVERYVGDGSEFESLREYVPGLDHRAMNWKASARHRMLVCTEFRAERNHQVVIATDTGHLMAEPLEGVPKLDHAINAGLQLAYIGLRTGDRVGWYAFDSETRAWHEPDSGTAAFRRVQRATAELAYSYDETNFTVGLLGLLGRLRRRSLVVLLTDFKDTVTAELMLDNVRRLSRRHLVLFVALRDPELEAVAAREPVELDDLYRAVVADDFVHERRLVLHRLQRLGIACIDAPPDRITGNLINRYLDIKRRELV